VPFIDRLIDSEEILQIA